MEGLLCVSRDEVRFSCRTRTFPDGYVEEMIASRPIFGPAGWEISGHCAASSRASGSRKKCGDVRRSARRAAAQLRRYCHCMDARYFVTLTVDAARCDRYDIPAVTRKLSQWADNQVRRRGLVYILVPELHKDGALHYHGLFNDALSVVDSGTLSIPGRKRPKRPRSNAERARLLDAGAQVIYNLPSWSFGFTTAIPLYGDHDRAISYVSKYIGKQSGQKIAGRWYYHGGSFGEPSVEYLSVCLQDIAAEGRLSEYHVIGIPDAGISIGLRGYRKGAKGVKGVKGGEGGIDGKNVE